MSEIINCRTEPRRALVRGAEVVADGSLLVLPTDTVYGLGANPLSKAAVDRLLTAKGRGRDKPSPVLVASIEQAESIAAQIPRVASRLMEAFWPGALTLVLPAREHLGWDLGETNGTVALRMPDDPFTLELLRTVGPLAVSSANLTGEPPAVSVQKAQAQLGEKVALYLDAGECGGGEPSTILVVDGKGSQLTIVRQGAIPGEDVLAVARAERGE